ncbi:hypothetical protein, partial [Lunatimonas salinarum]|uniref:hypothetical protein n=1 Tax=Lunatimonas salinarum TaxID=1774590 RepID=UPI001ADFE4CE
KGVNVPWRGLHGLNIQNIGNKSACRSTDVAKISARPLLRVTQERSNLVFLLNRRTVESFNQNGHVI